MAISKAIRQLVYEKYNGRCAYCGRKIDYKDMQVDPFVAKRGWSEEGTDDISNLMPSCRMCNHYKRANPLELFRKYIQEIPRKLRSNYIYKVGVAYGNVIENEKPINFYFETKDKVVEDNDSVVEVVRCRDCQWYDNHECQNPYIHMSDAAHIYTYATDYCSYGLRKPQ